MGVWGYGKSWGGAGGEGGLSWGGNLGQGGRNFGWGGWAKSGGGVQATRYEEFIGGVGVVLGGFGATGGVWAGEV